MRFNQSKANFYLNKFPNSAASFVIAALLFFPGFCHSLASDEEKFNPFVIFDLREKKEIAYSFSNKEKLSSEQCADAYNDFTQSNVKANDVSDFLSRIEGLSCTSARHIRKSPTWIDVFVLYKKSDKTPKIKVDEKKKYSRFKDDLRVFLTVAQAIEERGNQPFRSTGQEKVGYELVHERYRQKHKRADITIDISVEEDTLMTLSNISGPEEHWFISSDILLGSASELKYDTESKTLVSKDKPSDFYIGFNYMLGDLFMKEQHWSKRIFLKSMIKADRHPLESYGIGIGYRPEGLDSTSFFLAYVVSKEDKIVDGTLRENSGRNEEIRLGISLNIDSALKWLED